MASFASKHGIYDRQQRARIKDIIAQVKADHIETIRVSFADQHGVMRGKSFAADQLATLFEQGMTAPSSLLLKDLAHRTVLPVWSAEQTGLAGLAGIGDIVLMPDPDRFHVLPWLENTAWIQADIYHKDGMPSPLDTRGIARRWASKLAENGYVFNAGLELEVHVYKHLDQPLSAHDIGQPGTAPDVEVLNRGFQLLTEHYADDLEPILQLIRSTCQGLDIPIRSLEVEFGPSQIEFTCGVRQGITAADDIALLKNALRQVLARHGYHISFMCRPAIDGSFASGWHLHQSLTSLDGNNLFVPNAGETLSRDGQKWVAGLLHHTSAMMLFAVPTITGYKRFRAHSLAPERICWSQDGRGALLRSLCYVGDDGSRIENRVGEPAANPYLYLASQMSSGFDGLNNDYSLPPVALDAYDSALPKLPHTLWDAVDAAVGSKFVRAAFGDVFVDTYTAIKRDEIQRYLSHVSDWEHREYFASL